MDMDKLILIQLAQKEMLETFIINYNKDGKDRRTENYYKKRLSNFQSLWDEASKMHRELIICKLSNPSEAENREYFKNDVFSQMESHFMKNYAAIEDRFQREFPCGKEQSNEPTEPQSQVTILRSNAEESSIRLPKISLEKFCGDYKKWPTFHDLFKTLIHDKDLPAVQKLQYLKLHLGGEAQNLLRHFQITESNYEAAWKLLTDRYNNKRVLITTHLKTLLSQTSITQETAQGIKGLLDTTTECLHALSNLDIDVKNWDVLIVYLIVQRLPSETHQLWEQNLSNRRDLPSWSELQEFLECRFRTLEAVAGRKQTATKDNRNQMARSKSSMQTFSTTTENICIICSGHHNVRQCPRFSSLDPSRRLETAKSKGLCLNCLGVGHIMVNCPSQRSCAHCRKRHHTLLHNNPTNFPRNQRTQSFERNPNQSHSSNAVTNFREVTPSSPQVQSTMSISSPVFMPQTGETTSSHVNSFLINDAHISREILLATALVRVIAPSGREQLVRALIDQGSQASFVSETVAQALRLPKESIRANISGVGQTTAGQATARVQLIVKSRGTDATAIKVEGLILKKLTHLLPNRKILTEDWEHLRNLELADPSYYEPGRIDLLLGADVYSKIIQSGLIKGKSGSPIAQKTLFGWILTGEVCSIEKRINNFHIVADLDTQLRRFWEIEELKEKKILSEEEQKCEEIFSKTYHRLENGRYEVALPFNDLEGSTTLGSSRASAVSRLLQMESRFKANSLLQIEYAKCLQEYITLGHMEEVKARETNLRGDEDMRTTHAYLPHHAVTKYDSTTTKLRVVFDASRKTSNGISLNDILLKGPTIQDELACLLLRWRKYKIALTADIEKMYRQIYVKPEHAEYQRIVWRNSDDERIKDYKLLTVTFGTKSAPFLATRVLQQLASDEKERYPIGSEATLKEFYVDDLLSGADTVLQAREKKNQLVNLLQAGGFNLRKWMSNCPDLTDNSSETQRKGEVLFQTEQTTQVKALGLQWNPFDDTLCYTLKLDDMNSKCTKRTILSDVAKLFDPLGWAAPTVVIAKTFIQKLWLAKLDWDETVPQNIKREWTRFRESLMELNTVKLPRWLHTSPLSRAVEIHGFSDASLMAYAAVVYVCVTNSEGKRNVAILAAKTKVAPIKTISLPRLELCGAVLLAKLLKYVTDALELSNHTIHAWTDSQIVLAWLRGQPSKWKTFIANRVSHIHELVGQVSWKYVPSKENPADCATRGLLPSELNESELWWNGPKWLKMSKELWPISQDIPDTNLETRKIAMTCLQASVERLEEKYSSLTKLLRVTAYCYRFKSRERGYIKASELHEALNTWIKKIQLEHFKEEITALKRGLPLKSSSRLIKLTPFLHSDGLLRVGGRLRFAEISFDEKHPIILPDKCHLTTLIINKTHTDTLHGGPQLMMRVLARKFWLLNARNLVRQYVHKCIICHRQRADMQTQLMGDLPRPRVTMSRPFSHVGIDYCGPFNIRQHRGRGSKTYKGYVAIFICMAVKAIHIELVTDLNAQAFVAAFRRFVARRGLCSDVYCDCGSNFIGGQAILRRQRQQMIDETELASLIEGEGVRFHFIPPGSPHFGGLWEAGVKSTKFHMKRILGNSTLTYEELSTTLTQIEACLNSRPLYAMNSDPDDTAALTPAHFLVGDILLTPPEPSVLKINIHRLDRWQFVQQLYQSFWKRWNAEYLCRLQQRPKWMQKKRNIAPGDLVIVKEENLPPTRWLLGRVLETHPGPDDLVRVVTVKTKNSVLKRPVTKICLLPIDPVYDDAHNNCNASADA